MTWDVTRRAAMSGGAVGLVAAGAGLSGSPVSARVPATIIVEESAVPESRQFAEAFANTGHPARIVSVDRTLTGLLHELEASDCRFTGLTSDPAAMIAAQLLLERGGRPLLRWTHYYGGRGWTHTTAGAPSSLTQASYGWPTALAHYVQDMFDAPERHAMDACRSNSCRLPASSPGMLVSWVIEVGVKRS